MSVFLFDFIVVALYRHNFVYSRQFLQQKSCQPEDCFYIFFAFYIIKDIMLTTAHSITKKLLTIVIEAALNQLHSSSRTT